MLQIEDIGDVGNSADESANESSDKVMNQQFDTLCEQYYHSWFRFHPEEAVDVGVYDFANQLRSFEHDDIGALIALNQKMQSALEELNHSELDTRRQIDYRLINGAISIELHDLEENDWRYRDPLVYIPVNAIYQLLIHPGENVHQAIKHRLELMPEYLRSAKVMLSTYPERVVPQWAATAKDIARTGADFIRGLDRHPLITAKFTNPARLQPLFDAAANALNDFSKYIEIEVLPSAEGKFASGHNRFNRLINEKHYLETDAEKILNFGERLAKKTESELLQHSKNICGEENINKALASVRSNHPDASQLLDTYRQKMLEAHDWLREADIVTLPEKQSLKVQQTPEFLRDVIPFAAYEPPMPLDDEQRGLYYVTTVEDASLLAEHNEFSIDLTSVHEAFPGHHLQFVIANQNNASVTRLLNASASMYEGWALYCEQLVFEQGLYNKKEHEFILLRDRLWRALRIIIDVKMHTGQFTFDDAVALLTNKLGFDESQAAAEINWYSNAAGTPLCYAIGREIILKTRETIDTSDKSELKAFHDALLSQGSIALPLIVQTVFGESVWQTVHDSIFTG
ncbi:hypothetical protein MNBD_GAMMA05-2203 [hydrothermal vent metagenome]|uniref:DUF885 domain-containing protein n=1 Tax=hydrothermal vent metagenome TaxID=652676 RepID=A0A3B0WWP6_9ZZZZ